MLIIKLINQSGDQKPNCRPMTLPYFLSIYFSNSLSFVALTVILSVTRAIT